MIPVLSHRAYLYCLPLLETTFIAYQHHDFAIPWEYCWVPAEWGVFLELAVQDCVQLFSVVSAVGLRSLHPALGAVPDMIDVLAHKGCGIDS